MAYTIAFYALRPGLYEIVVTVHRVEPIGLVAYTGTSGMALAAARKVEGEPRADGFTVTDGEGRVVLDDLDRPGRG